jgi:predicted ATP-dependent endonuclease of OLD family
VDIFINDGNDTSLEYKGDGVKSLAALGLLKFRNAGDGASLLAIEEPEAHLHPGAIHQVSEIVRSISENAQVIVTTHNPLFVDRLNLKSNILVQDGAAVSAKNISVIRDALGIKASDNLLNANFALVVEGEEDVIAMRALLPFLSNKIGAVLRSGLVIIEPIGGAGNLSYKLSLLRTMLCATYSLLDSDDEGVRAYERAERDGLCTQADCTFIRCRGFQEAEFEDCVNPELYMADVTEQFGVNLDCAQFRGAQKWSRRVRACFEDQGKIFNDKVCSKVKYLVAKAVEQRPADALHPHKRNSIDALVVALERLVN